MGTEPCEVCFCVKTPYLIPLPPGPRTASHQHRASHTPPPPQQSHTQDDHHLPSSFSSGSPHFLNQCTEFYMGTVDKSRKWELGISRAERGEGGSGRENQNGPRGRLPGSFSASNIAVGEDATLSSPG